MKQKIIIVNKNDEIVDYKERGTLKQEDIYRVSALLVKNSKGEFLLAQRKFTKKNNPGEWYFSVAGTNGKGETYDENIRKEIEEEIGIKNLEYKKLFKQRRYGKHNYFCQFYIATLDVDLDYFTIQEDEVEAIRWFSIEGIKKGVFKGNSISKTLFDNLELFI